MDTFILWAAFSMALRRQSQPRDEFGGASSSSIDKHRGNGDSQETQLLRDSRNGRCLRGLASVVMLLLCAGCGEQSEKTGGDGMFSSFVFKNKNAEGASTVAPDVGAPLVREASLPATVPAPIGARRPRELAFDGVPPRGKLLDQAIAGQTTTAFVVDRGGQAPVALVNINNPQQSLPLQSFEVWELSSVDKPDFVRKRTAKLDPAQDSWSGFSLVDAAYLPGDQLLLAVYFFAPHVKQGLFLYDMANDSYSMIDRVWPYPTFDQRQLFEAQIVAPDAVMIQYYSNATRLGPDVYYNAPGHLRLYTIGTPKGIEVLRLSPADGSINAWGVIDGKLWIEAKDTRPRKGPKEFIWSLSLEKVLPR